MVLLAVLAYVPMLLTKPGQVSADTKSYLTIDPGGLLARASSMWDPLVGAGTVPHQNIGYLFPLGPYYWLADTIGLPDWVAQRLVWATVVFAAAWGTWRLLRWLGWPAQTAFVAAFAYGFSPYLLSYLARLSAILFPWAALPWMILLAAKSVRDRSWGSAAAFAGVVAVVGSVNATSLVFAGLGPVIWILGDVVERRVTPRAAAAGSARIGVLCLGVSAWWIVGLSVQGSFGLPILDYTESYQTVASASTPNEILRGLGYWFFYGGDRLGSWVGPSAPYINHPIVIFLGYALAGIALLGLLAPFSRRLTFCAMFVVGLVISVGAAPLAASTTYGWLFENFVAETTVGGALRSTPRAAPLVLLTMACGLGSAVGAAQAWLRVRHPRVRPRFVAAFATVAVGLQLFPWFTGTVTTPALLRPDALPSSVEDLAAALGADDASGRVYAIPGADFADYRWGGTVDPVLPGIVDRPVLYRELVPQGGDGTADLLNAIERRFVEGWFEPASLPAVADLFAVDTVVVRNDLQYERYRLARPGIMWTQSVEALGAPVVVGELMVDQPEIAMTDEITLAHRDAPSTFPAFGVFEVANQPPVEVYAASPVVVAGSGDGVVDLAATGALGTERPVLYAATLDDHIDDGADVAALLGADPWWVITDSNRKQGRRWSTLGFNLGTIEAVGPAQTVDDPNDKRLVLFDDDLDEMTSAVFLGDVAAVTATSYGSDILYTAEDAPAFAVDGDPATAWRTAIAEPTTGERLTIELREPTPVNQIVLQQPQLGATNRFITGVRIGVDGRSFDVALDETSLGAGQLIELSGPGGDGMAQQITVEVRSDNVGVVSSYAGLPGVGFAEVTLIREDGSTVSSDRSVRVPTTSGLAISDEERLTYLFSRERIDPATPNRRSPEEALDRSFDSPTARSLDLTAAVRVAASAPDEVLIDLLDRDPALTVARASARLDGAADRRGTAAVDGRMDTAWETPFDGATGATLTIEPATETAADAMHISWLDDALHDVPTQVEVRAGATATVVTLPASEPTDGVASAVVDLTPFASGIIEVTIVETTGRTTPEYFSGAPRRLPVGLAEVSFGDEPNPTHPDTAVALPCRDDLLTLDGEPVQVRIRADDDGALVASSCDTVEIGAGEHRIEATAGRSSGLDIDWILLDSPGGDRGGADAVPSRASSGMEITSTGSTHLSGIVAATEQPTWLVLSQSLNAGWTASVDGVDLGPPTLINGYANGWLLPAGDTDRRVELRWTPQRGVSIAIGVSATFGALILVLVLRRARTAPAMPTDPTSARRFRRWPRRTPTRLAVIAGWALCWALVGGVAAGIASAVVAVVASRWPRADVRLVGAIMACVAWGAVSGLIIAFEYRYDFADGPDWQERFVWASPITWIAVSALITSVMADTIRRSSRTAAPGASKRP